VVRDALKKTTISQMMSSMPLGKVEQKADRSNKRVVLVKTMISLKKARRITLRITLITLMEEISM
jgi:hypothetical protein